LALYNDGTLERYGVQMIGANADAIDKAENRQRSARRWTASAWKAQRPGWRPRWSRRSPCWNAPGCRRSSALLHPGGTGGGIAYNRTEFDRIVREGLAASPTTEVLIEESLLGWKEFEMEVVRDRADNCIIICSIENVDPMGVHTGDRITVAPALTLTDKEYQIMRSASIAVLREIGVETGGSNDAVRVNPKGRAADRDRDEPARLALVSVRHASKGQETGVPAPSSVRRRARGGVAWPSGVGSTQGDRDPPQAN
jgi:carbamoyl-phosphate synthase large subunit